MPPQRNLQTSLDDWLPTVARWAGFILTLVLFVALLEGHTEVTPGFVPAAGLMLYKSVKQAASNGGNSE